MKNMKETEFEFSDSKQVLDLSIYINPLLHGRMQKDGRPLANLIEDILDIEFSNLTKKDDNAYYDMDAEGDRRVEVRTMGKTPKFSFDASSNVGGGRAGTDLKGTLAKIEKVTDWIFVDNRTFPNVAIYHLSGEKLRAHLLANPQEDRNYRSLTFLQAMEAFYE